MTEIEIDVTGLDEDERAVVALLYADDPQLAVAYARARTPQIGVVVAGYPYTDELPKHRPRSAPHWSGVVFWPFAKGEIIRVVAERDEQGRKPAKWPVLVEWFGTDAVAARRRSLDVHTTLAVALLDDSRLPEDATGQVPMPELRVCAWCGVKAHPASMEAINSVSVACRNVEA